MLPEIFFLGAPNWRFGARQLNCEGAKYKIQSATLQPPIFMSFLEVLEHEFWRKFEKFTNFYVKLRFSDYFSLSATNVWERRAPPHIFWAPILSLSAPKWRRKATSGSTGYVIVRSVIFDCRSSWQIITKLANFSVKMPNMIFHFNLPSKSGRFRPRSFRQNDSFQP